MRSGAANDVVPGVWHRRPLAPRLHWKPAVARTVPLTSPIVALAVGAVVLGQAMFLHPAAIPAVVRVHDHTVHVLVYGTVGAVAAWWSSRRAPQRGLAYHLAMVQLIALHLGLADEILQSTSLGREASPHDLVADCAGSFAGAVMLLLMRRDPARLLTRRAAAVGAIYVAGLAAALLIGTASAVPGAPVFVVPITPGVTSGCASPARGGVVWRLDIGAASARPALGEGWSVDEHVAGRSATWSEGTRSRIDIELVPQPGPHRLALVAMGAVDPARRAPPVVTVIVNGHVAGRVIFPLDFAPRTVTIPAGVLRRGSNSIELEHLRTYLPPDDGRELSIMLDEVCLETYR